MIKKLTRNSTCGSLCLPPTLACVWCITSIERALQKGTNPRSIKKCIRPWSSKWANHRELKHVLSYKEIRQYLGLEEETEEDHVEVKSVYSRVNHSTKESIGVSDNDSIVNLNLSTTTYAAYSTESNIVLPPRAAEVIRASPLIQQDEFNIMLDSACNMKR